MSHPVLMYLNNIVHLDRPILMNRLPLLIFILLKKTDMIVEHGLPNRTAWRPSKPRWWSCRASWLPRARRSTAAAGPPPPLPRPQLGLQISKEQRLWPLSTVTLNKTSHSHNLPVRKSVNFEILHSMTPKYPFIFLVLCPLSLPFKLPFEQKQLYCSTHISILSFFYRMSMSGIAVPNITTTD